MKKKKKITDIKKPKKRIKSIWVVLLTSLVTTLVVGGGFASYIYWQENFMKKDDTNQPEAVEDKIEGKNVVIATSNNGNLFINFYNSDSKRTITKKIETGVTIQGGKWEKDNKNEVVKFIDNGEYFIVSEIKEPSLSDESEFTRIVKYSKDGEERDVLIEDKNSLSIGNFVYGSGKVYYIYTNFDGSDILSKDLYSFDIETKKSEIVVENIGDFLEKELTFKDDKIYSLYVLRGNVYESVVDVAARKITKTSLFRAAKTTDFELTSKDVYPSSDFSKYIFMYYTQKEGYQLKLYDKTTKKTSILKKDKDFSFEDVFWKSNDEIVFKKNPAFSASGEAKESVILLNINDVSSEKVLIDSGLDINTIFISEGMVIYSEDSKMYLLKDKEERAELSLTGFFGIQDTLTSAIFDYNL